MKLLQFVGLLLVVLIGFTACNKSDEPPVDLKRDYFPTDSGRYWIYDVDSILFDDFNEPNIFTDTLTSQILEVITAKFTDLQGQESCRVERYWRSNESAPWKLINVWSTTLTATSAERIEENLRFVKLVFPLSIGTKWNGNVFINVDQSLEYLEDWEYEITSLDEPATINELNFDKALTVLYQDWETEIDKKYGTEQYARNVGLIYKEVLFLKKDFPKPWSEPRSGFIVKMSIKEFGTI